MYVSWYAKSRFDEFIFIVKLTGMGVAFLFFIIYLDDTSVGYIEMKGQRVIIVLYWVSLIILTGLGRFLIHTYQREQLLKGKYLKNSLIIGSEKKSKELFDEIKLYPALGYNIVAILSAEKEFNDSKYRGIEVFNGLEKLPDMLREKQIEEVVIAIESNKHDLLLDIISICEPYQIGIKVMPDMYDIFVGQARMNQLYGTPLIDLSPPLLPEWERKVKRMLDFIIATIALIISIPAWVIVSILIKLDSEGTIFYKQIRVGQFGKHFNFFKFRSMVNKTEKTTGPVWSSKNDQRITKFGKFLRKYRLDEIPNLFCIFTGKMSLVGPRPERPYFVEKLSKEIPLYKRRLRVKPGITGWAQVRHIYDESIEGVKVKLQYDLYYIENMSLRLDFKIVILTLYTILFGRGR
jgi:exopolysaccharide biosynthesis polyprenyl glycosylphosphotransferase